MITVITGPPRAGKSYKMVYDSLRELTQGRRIYQNGAWRHENVERWLRLRHGYSGPMALRALRDLREIRTLEEMFALIAVPNARLNVDEAGDWFPAREHRILPHSLLTYFRQHGKQGMDVTIICQDLAGIDSQIRKCAGEIFQVRPAPLTKRIMSRLKHGRRGVKLMRYQLVQDTSESTVRTKLNGTIDAVQRVEYRVLDYLVACCYDSRSIFSSPFEHLQKRMNAKAAAVFEEIGAVWDSTVLKTRYHAGLALDGMPVLTPFDVAELERTGARASDLLHQRMLDREAETYRELGLPVLQLDKPVTSRARPLAPYAASALSQPGGLSTAQASRATVV